MSVDDRVRLPPNEDEGWPEEFGKVDTPPNSKGMTTVVVDKRFRDDPMDDGLREIHMGSVELIKKRR